MKLSIVIALPKIEDARKIRSVLNRYGFSVTAVCNTGAGALSIMSDLDAGVLICGYHLPDMYYNTILADKPAYFDMLLMASGSVAAQVSENVSVIQTPIKPSELNSTLHALLDKLHRKLKRIPGKPKTRNERDKKKIQEAKELLMQVKEMSEEDAYRYIQKCSMDSGINMVETAEMILMLEGRKDPPEHP
ncbi:MAG: ANTAR domain-containing protein [Blautia sp.]|nr:ANTAR domain-containing protein [Blautia sp.]